MLGDLSGRPPQVGVPVVGARHFDLLQVDVFSDTPLGGNPLAVFPDAVGLSGAEMQAIAREMNLSETTFVLPPKVFEADYQVRIFTPRDELPFAGHPTIGTAHALVESGRMAREGDVFTLHQQTLAGVQPIEVTGRGGAGGGRLYTMTQPTPRFAPAPPVERLARALRVDEKDVAGTPLTVSVGVVWHIVPLRSLDVVRRLDPDMSALAELERDTDGTAVTVFCREAEDPACAVRVRSFAPGSGIPEDPVCGSGNGCVGAYLAETEQRNRGVTYRAEQGIEMGRPGRAEVRVDRDGDGWRVRVGGSAVTVLEGRFTLPDPV